MYSVSNTHQMSLNKGRWPPAFFPVSFVFSLLKELAKTREKPSVQ